MQDQILITGATGDIGRPLTFHLAAQGVPLRLFVRHPEKARALEGASVEIFPGDLRDLAALEQAMRGIDTLFPLSSASPEQVKLQSNAVRAADHAGVRRIVKVSALGASPHSPVMLARWHAQTECEIRRTGLDYTLLHPTPSCKTSSCKLSRSSKTACSSAPSGTRPWRWWMPVMWPTCSPPPDTAA